MGEGVDVTRRRRAQPVPIRIGDVSFPPVMERDGLDCFGVSRFRQAEVNGKALWAVPGGLMAFADHLPAIAAQIKNLLPTPKQRHRLKP